MNSNITDLLQLAAHREQHGIHVVTPESFEAACRAHDHSACMSDDHRVWQRHREATQELKRMAAELGVDAAVEIYNRVVLEKFGGWSARNFIWVKPPTNLKGEL